MSKFLSDGSNWSLCVACKAARLLSLLSTPAAYVTKKLKFNLELELPLKTKELTRLWLWLAT